MKRFFINFFIKSIEFYQKFISPIFFLYFGINCRYYPSCSEYTKQAIKEFGIIQGFLLGLKRLLRCHPFCSGGYDPVPKNPYRRNSLNG